DCGCSKGNVEDQILVPKPPKNYERCTRCGYLVDGPNCQGCALLRQELEENLVTHSSDFQNTSEPSNASTNVVNAPRKPYVVKQDNGSFVDKLPSFFAITPDEPVLSTEEPGNSLSMGDEHLDTIPAMESDEFIKSSVENLIPISSKSEGIPEHMCDVPFHDNSLPLDVLKVQIKDLSESNETISLIDDDSFSIDDIDYVEASPPDSELVNSEVMEIVIPEISSGSTTTYSDISLLEYKAFYDDHVKEITSGSPTTHSDSPLYASFIFDLSINPFPPADRSDSYEFTDELIPFISAPEYDCFLFKVEPNSRDFTKDVKEDISPTKEPQVLNALPTHPTLQLNMKNEDIIFDPGICNSHFSRPDTSHRCRTVKKFNTHRSHLNGCPMLIHGQNNPPLDVAQKKLKEKQIEEERAAKAKYWKLLVCYDDDDDEERSDSLNDNIISGFPSTSAITPDEPVLSTEEPDNSLSIGDEHLDTILATESDEFIKSGVENLIPIPSESEGIPE
nr:hypothetical protein [Tanacetum cinerariifolium]